MTVEFQEDLLAYLHQHKEAKAWTKYLDKTVFDNPYWALIFESWQKYTKKYNHIPSKANALEFFEEEWKTSAGTEQLASAKKEIINVIHKCYSPIGDDVVFIVDQIVLFAQRKLTRRLFMKAADKIPNATGKLFDNIHKEMAKIVSLREQALAADTNKGHDYIAEPEVEIKSDKVRVMPCAFEAVNRMTAAGGFYAPQLVVILKGPKAFGTGVLLTLAAYYLKRGEKVYYADTENGLLDIYTRLDMALLNCEFHEIPKYRKELLAIKKKIALKGGTFISDYYEGGVATLDELDSNLEARADKGFKPTVMFNDYIDKFQPTDRTIKENNLKTQHTYAHQIRLNSKYGFPCFTITPVVASAFKNAVLRADDMGNDKYKAYNCHASFALCATEEEVKASTIRLIPVSQRLGTAFKYNARTTCALKVAHERMHIEELDAEAYLSAMPDLYSSNPDKPKKAIKYIDLKGVKDE